MTEKDSGVFIFNDNNSGGSHDNLSYPSKPFDNLPANQANNLSIKPYSLYDYTLGIKNIEASYATYNETEVFVSKPIHITDNVMEVELETIEEHPVFDDLSGNAIDKLTSVEYYISYKEKPAPADWIPILPKNVKAVKGERMFLTGNRGRLLFQAEMPTVKVYENGLLLDALSYGILNNQEIQITKPNTSSIYTVSYLPYAHQNNPWVIQLNDYKQYVTRITETFTSGTDINKTISLAHAPFIDVQRIIQEEHYNPNTSEYKPIQVTLKNASIQGKNRNILKAVAPYRENLLGNAYTYNKTLYLNKSWSDMKEYNLDATNYYGGFDYYQYKNKLTFTENFNVKRLAENQPYTHGNADIEVSYDTLVADFRLKAILRRNTATEITATPKLNNYQINFKTTK